jgi:hypothetical protein
VPGKFWCTGKKCKATIEQAVFDKEDKAISWFCPECGHTSEVSLLWKRGY